MDLGRRTTLTSMFAAATAMLCPAAAAARTSATKPQVFVAATLYSRHAKAPGYDLAALRALIEAIKPDALVLDVSPTELAQQKVWPGKIEYTGVIFPYLNATKLPAYASEPAEPLFAEISGAAGKAYAAFKAADADGSAALKALKDSTYAALVSGWRTPADVHGARTDEVVAGLRAIEEALVGGEVGPLQERWDEHHAARVLDAARKHPGQRVLMLVGIESRFRVLRRLSRSDAIELVDLEAWLRARN